MLVLLLATNAFILGVVQSTATSAVKDGGTAVGKGQHPFRKRGRRDVGCDGILGAAVHVTYSGCSWMG